MADSPLTVPRDSQGNIPKWVLVGGGIVAVVALYSFVKNKQTGTGGGTVAAGTSINAALGSLQEEVLNQQGQIDTSLAAQQSQIDTSLGNVATGLGGVQAGISGIGANDLAQMQSYFETYAQQNFNWNRNLGGGAGSLALPQNLADFENFLKNPSLANPAYQSSLVESRGFVFDNTTNSQSDAHQVSAATGTF